MYGVKQLPANFAANSFLTDRNTEYNYVTLSVDVPCAVVALKPGGKIFE